MKLVKIRLLKAEVINGSVWSKGSVVETDEKTARHKIGQGAAELINEPVAVTPPVKAPSLPPPNQERTDSGDEKKKEKKEK